MSGERVARLLIVVFAVGLPVIAVIASTIDSAAGQAIEVHARLAESGGWTPSDIRAQAGQPIRLRLTSDDVLHSFAIGQSDRPAIDVKPGEVTEVTLTFDRPGKYTFYCTRWCGPNHWRMRGTIEVSSGQRGSEQWDSEQRDGEQLAVEAPLYVALGLDIDAPHLADVLTEDRPSAVRGMQLGVMLPPAYLSSAAYRTRSPVEVWKSLRAESFTRGLSDAQVWDLVALVWQSNTMGESLQVGRGLFAANCAACHGENGAGDGVMAASLAEASHSGDMQRHDTTAPADFTDPASMLGASPALLHGKIVRGGMGTGMPYFGPIFTDDQVWAVISYLWTFQFDVEGGP